MTWWEALAEYLDARGADGEAPDPWADVELGASALTDEQVAYLAFDQPAVPRLSGLTDPEGSAEVLDEPPGDGTGNSPGDS